jgi:BirA family biotin operon repressor/biotin-[acetyl-CoA-carboxylase] ligase
MPLAVELAHAPETRSGTLVVTDEQTQGRGRRGRGWHAPPRTALLVSVILKAPMPPPTHIPLLAAGALWAAVARAAPTLAPQLALKWPNDLVWGRDPAQMRKVGGVLAESRLDAAGALHDAVLGIGLNVNQRADQLPRLAPPTLRAGSLRVALGQPLDRTELLALLCEALSHSLAQSPAAIHHQWATQLITLGQAVAVYHDPAAHTPTLTGQAVAVAADGALIVADDAGIRHTVHAADVSIRPIHPPAA